MLTLSSDDLARLECSLRVLLSPLDHAHLDDWRSAVNRNVKELLGADKATFVLPNPLVAALYSEEIDARGLEEYPLRSEPLYHRLSLWRRPIELGVCSTATVWAPCLEEYLASEYYNDFLVPLRAYDAVGLAVALEHPTDAKAVANLFLHHENPSRRQFGERGLALLRLLFPAFKAGVETYRQLAEHRTSLVRMIDSLGEGVLLCDATGRVLHRNGALLRVLESETDAERLLGEMQGIAFSLCRLIQVPARGNRHESGGAVVREVRTATARYRLRGSMIGSDSLGAGSSVMVALERLTPNGPRKPCSGSGTGSPERRHGWRGSWPRANRTRRWERRSLSVRTPRGTTRSR